jgi:hypothetical protein
MRQAPGRTDNDIKSKAPRRLLRPLRRIELGGACNARLLRKADGIERYFACFPRFHLHKT